MLFYVVIHYYDPAEAKRIGVNWVAGEEHDFKANFPKTLAKGERVLKQNRGSTGEGIWRVQLKDQSQYGKFDSIPLDTIVRCTEAVDNHAGS